MFFNKDLMLHSLNVQETGNYPYIPLTKRRTAKKTAQAVLAADPPDSLPQQGVKPEIG
jgi:hypothetical protein